MKEVKVIHINDGTSVELTNGNRHFAEESVWAGEMLSMYLNAGYEINQIIPDFTPGTPGGYAFYKTGFTAILIRDVKEGNIEITAEDWEEANTEGDYGYFYSAEGYDDDDFEDDNLEDVMEFDFSDEDLMF
ncbi:MAG: hypothetical protein E7218_07665 [Anaerofustis stercorihominis]|nr:hypothetical protein [Anaerofustis stercorihominis]